MLELYSTQDCHLCDQARVLLDRAGAVYTVVDIAESAGLVERYGVRIPVIRHAVGRELGWPFDESQLQEFLSACR